MFTHGDIPDGMCCLHKCDNRLCVSPDHLFLGTKADNTHDMIRKGRWRSPPLRTGETATGAKLTESDVREIRKLGSEMTQKNIGLRYGVSQVLVGKILRREVWKHLD